MTMTQSEVFLEDEVLKLESQLQAKDAQLRIAYESIEHLESVIHKAALIANHIPFLCSTLAEVSPELEQAAVQVRQILVDRKV